MIDFDRDFAGVRELQKLTGVETAGREAYELDGTHAIGRHLAGVEADALTARIEADPDVTFEADQLAQCAAAFLRVGIFDEHRGGQLARSREQLVVRIDLMTNRGFLTDSFRTNHLFDLIPDGLAVLKE